MPWQDFVIAMTAMIIGGTIFVVPVVAFTLRRSLQPLIETWAKAKEATVDPEAPRLRDAALEERLTDIETVLARLVEETEFHNKLRDPDADPTP